MKFDVVTRFRETIPKEKMFRHPRSRKKISNFDRNYHFTIFQKIRIFSGFTLTLLIISINLSVQEYDVFLQHRG